MRWRSRIDPSSRGPHAPIKIFGFTPPLEGQLGPGTWLVPKKLGNQVFCSRFFTSRSRFFTTFFREKVAYCASPSNPDPESVLSQPPPSKLLP